MEKLWKADTATEGENLEEVSTPVTMSVATQTNVGNARANTYPVALRRDATTGLCNRRGDGALICAQRHAGNPS